MNKNTIPLIVIVIVIICFGLGGLGLVIHNIKNDEKHLRLRLDQMEHHHEPPMIQCPTQMPKCFTPLRGSNKKTRPIKDGY